MAAKKQIKKGRPPTPRKRIGKVEWGVVNHLLSKIKRGFTFKKGDSKTRETTLNARLIALLKQADDRVVNRDLAKVTFVGKRYHPECTLSVEGRPYALFAVECKKLHDHSAKRLLKEGLAQALLYLTISKVVALVLYDFTKNRDYKKAFGPGNGAATRFAKRMRDESGLYILVLSP